jgi:uncharacterized membrane protein SirB2
MADHYRGRTRRDDDTMVPLITGLVVIAAAGPALFTAATQWLVPRLSAGRDAVSVGFGEWWGQNWWLVVFWVLELAVLFGFVVWSRRRRQRRSRQIDSVVAGLARVMPADWEPNRDVRVLRWTGHRPVRLRVQLTPRSALDDPSWRRSMAEAARRVLGPLEPIAWPQPPRSGVFDWGVRPPRIELRVTDRPPAEELRESLDSPENRTDQRFSDGSAPPTPRVSNASAEELQIYRRPRPESPERVAAEHGSASTRLDRED